MAYLIVSSIKGIEKRIEIEKEIEIRRRDGGEVVGCKKIRKTNIGNQRIDYMKVS
jgi:methylthioribose-1-phosphate isomerase